MLNWPMEGGVSPPPPPPPPGPPPPGPPPPGGSSSPRPALSMSISCCESARGSSGVGPVGGAAGGAGRRPSLRPLDRSPPPRRFAHRLCRIRGRHAPLQNFRGLGGFFRQLVRDLS